MGPFETSFSLLDWLIVIAYLTGTVAIGVYVNRFIGDMGDYIVAGRSLKSFASIATMVGSELGLVTVMYSAEKGLTGGFAAFHIGVVAGLITLLVGLTGFIVVPLRRLNVMTIPEYYEKRFSRGVRIFGGLILALSGILNMGLFLKAGAIFVAGLTGMTSPLQVNLVMTVLLAIVLAYTILGGMVSVVITDYVQFVVLSFGMIACCVLAVGHLGWQSIVDTVAEIHGMPGFDPSNAKGFGPSYIVWMAFMGLVSCGVWQTAVMRACAAESTAVVKRLYTWSSIGFLVRFMVPQFLGICALVYFWQHDAGREIFFTAKGGLVADRKLEALPVFLGQILPTGVIGLIGAGMLAAFMSTHDSYLLCWASVLAHDVVAPLSDDRLSTTQTLFVARLFIFLIGIFLLVWGLWYPLGQDLWDYMAVSGAIYFTGAFAVLLLGLYWKGASTTGAYWALTSGLFALVALTPVKNAFGPVWLMIGHKPSSEVIGLSTALMALVLMVAGSLLFPPAEAKEPPDVD